LLSQTLVAFTIEFDNEFEHRMPHRTAKNPSGHGPWLVSMAMWFNCMQFVGEEGVGVKELEKFARTQTNLNGMIRWGYVNVDGGLIRATRKGLKAREVWRQRFGADAIDELRNALWADAELPDCLPILKYGLFSKGPDCSRRSPASSADKPLPTLLSQVLLTFAMEFERESKLSLAISANVLRVLNETGVRMRDLPILSGVSKEAISMAMGILQKREMAVVEARVVGLTPKGLAAQAAYRTLVAAIEKRWNAVALHKALGRIAGGLEAIRWCCIEAVTPMAARRSLRPGVSASRSPRSRQPNSPGA
jgi:hypothetical protein